MIGTPPLYVDGVRTHHAPRWHLTLSNGVDLTRAALSGTISKAIGRTPRTTIRVDVATAGIPQLLDQRLLPTGATLDVAWSLDPYAERVTIASGPLVRSPLTRPASTWALEAVDPSGIVAVDQLDPLIWAQLPPPATIGALVSTIVRRTIPGAVIQTTGPATTMPVPAGLKLEGDAWDVIERAVAAAASHAWWRPDGILVVEPVPDLAAPVDILQVGNHGTITGYDLDHERGYSAVYLEYQDVDGTPRIVGRWADQRPMSPTAVARIGRAVIRDTIRTGLIPSQAEADAAAAAAAVRSAGRARRVVVRHIPHPWLEPGDTVRVGFSGGPIETHLVDAVQIPIGPGVQITTLRNHDYELRT